MSKKKSVITNAVRIVKAENIPFKLLEYEADEVGENFGIKIAELTGISPERCFKTLVVRGKEIMVICIPVDKEADLKNIAAVSGEKKVEMLPTKELLAATGYIRGGVSPIGMKKHYKTYIDKSCINFEEITVSGGVCGLSIMLSPQNLIKITGADCARLTKEI